MSCSFECVALQVGFQRLPSVHLVATRAVVVPTASQHQEEDEEGVVEVESKKQQRQRDVFYDAITATAETLKMSGNTVRLASAHGGIAVFVQ